MRHDDRWVRLARGVRSAAVVSAVVVATSSLALHGFDRSWGAVSLGGATPAVLTVHDDGR